MKLKFNLYGQYRIFLLALILIAAAVFLFIYLPGEGFPDNQSHQDGLYLKPVASDKAAAGNLEVLPGMEHMDEIDYNIVSPLEYLEILKQYPNSIYPILDVPDGWIKYEHIRELVKYVDSEEPCARVVSALSSCLPNIPSTVGKEAIFLIEGFLQGKYPPALHSEGFKGREVQWYKTIMEDYWNNRLKDNYKFVYLRSLNHSDIPLSEVKKYLSTPDTIYTVYDQKELEAVVSRREKKTCIWIDREAVKAVDQDWLYKKAVEDKYPVILIGYSNALYSFRDLLSICRYVNGPKIAEDQAKINGFSVYLLSNMYKQENSLTVESVFRGFPGNPDIREIVSISNKLLSGSSGLAEKKDMSPEEKLRYNYWAMKSETDSQELIDNVIDSLNGINWSELYNVDTADVFLIMEWLAERSLDGDEKALKCFLKSRAGLDGAFAESYFDWLLKILEEKIDLLVKSLAVFRNEFVDTLLNQVQYKLMESQTAVKRLKEAQENGNFNIKEKGILENLIQVSSGMAITRSVTVDTVEAFFEAIGSNTIIHMKPGVYKLDELPAGENSNPYAALITQREGNLLDGSELVIHDVENLSITGDGEKPVEILTKYQQVNVITFENAHNISLWNIRAGHWPDKGGCYGGVSVFKKSSDIKIDNCRFFGCGINGLELCNVKDAVITNSVIEYCNLHILCMNNSHNILFRKTDFINNRGTELINISGCRDVVFDECSITGNSGVTDIGVLFNIDVSGFSAYVSSFERNNIISNILIRNSIIKDNKTVSSKISRSPVESTGSLVFEDTGFEGNSFDAPSNGE